VIRFLSSIGLNFISPSKDFLYQNTLNFDNPHDNKNKVYVVEVEEGYVMYKFYGDYFSNVHFSSMRVNIFNAAYIKTDLPNVTTTPSWDYK
tara:strand:+ start:156 stop:428 length:273 start_codon:yes stop_codon:yes gene_type:complete